LGFVDLPLQRERITGFPIIQASELKGKLRSLAAVKSGTDEEHSKKVMVTFGHDKESASEYAGSISISDARVLLFPVRSLKGVFAWVTCEAVLTRFCRDLMVIGDTSWSPPALSLRNQDIAVAGDSILCLNNSIVLEEFTFNVRKGDNDLVRELGERLKGYLPREGLHTHFTNSLTERLAVVPDDAFYYFVQFATEIVTRIALDSEKKVVREHALWNEEYLPSETLLYATCFATKPRAPKCSLPAEWKDAPSAEHVLSFVKELADNKCFQLGGDETIGKGLVAASVYRPGEGG
jgi:CRISPR-associated protein Cmr4